MPPVATDMLGLVADALDESGGVLAVLERHDAAGGALVVRQANGAFCRAFAADAGALEGQNFAALAAPEESAKLQQLEGAAARREACRTELRCIRPNGTRLWLGLHLMPAGDAAHPGTLFVLLARDITASRLASEQQDAVQRLLASVFSAAEAGLAIVGQDGRFLMTNAYHDRMFGYEPGSLAGRPTLELLAPESREMVRIARAQQLVDLRRYALEATLLSAEGVSVPVTMVSAVVSTKDTQPYRVITVTPRGPVLPPARALHVHLTGKIRLVSLDDVKAALGERWEGMVARVMDAAERIVARQMIPGDTYFRTNDHGFVVCFPSASEEEATFRAAALAREIRHRLIGAGEDPETVDVSVLVAPLSAGEQRRATIEARMAEIEEQLRDEVWLPVGPAGFVFERVIAHDHGPVLGHFIRAPWPPPCRTVGVVALPPNRQEADLAALRFAQQVALDQPGSEALFVEIDFDCFFSRSRTQALVDVCHGFAAPVRQRIVLLLAGLSEGVSQSRVIDSISRVQMYCRAVGFVLDAPEMNEAEKVATVGTFVLLNAHAWDRSKALAHARITRLADGLHARKCSLIARGVDTADGRATLRDCGVNLFALATPPG